MLEAASCSDAHGECLAARTRRSGVSFAECVQTMGVRLLNSEISAHRLAIPSRLRFDTCPRQGGRGASQPQPHALGAIYYILTRP